MDRIGWRDYTRLVLQTPRYYPKIYRLAFSTFSLAEGIDWITAWLQLGGQAAAFMVYRAARPILRVPGSKYMLHLFSRAFPHTGLRIVAWCEGMEQVRRGTFAGLDGAERKNSWFGQIWPRG